MYPSEKRHVELIASLAKKAFAEHRVEQTLARGLYREWVCARPGTCQYRFVVTTKPGWLFVTGDVGFLALCREPDMIGWAREAAKDLDYFLGKAPANLQTRRFGTDVCRDWLDQEEAEIRRELAEDGPAARRREQLEGKLEKVAELREELEDGGGRFKSELYDSGLVDGADFPRLETFDSTALWCREAVAWLLARI